MPVYFVQAGEGGNIKIGYARNVQSRLSKMRVDCPAVLRLLAVCEGDVECERDLHARFAAHRVRGEWFLASPEILEFIAAQRPVVLPSPGRRGRRIRRVNTAMDEWMQEAGVSDDDLAADLGVDRTTISRARRAALLPSSKLISAMVRHSGGKIDPRTFFQAPYPQSERAA